MPHLWRPKTGGQEIIDGSLMAYELWASTQECYRTRASDHRAHARPLDEAPFAISVPRISRPEPTCCDQLSETCVRSSGVNVQLFCAVISPPGDTNRALNTTGSRPFPARLQIASKLL